MRDDRDTPEAPPYLVTLGFDPATFDRLDALRSRYFPPERNLVPAHLSLFHQLPGDRGPEIRSALSSVVAGAPPIELAFLGLFRLGGGMAARVEAPGLGAFHATLARRFSAWLTPQDRQPFRPHVTLMNKAPREAAARAFAELSPTWAPWGGVGDRLRLWAYLGGPWRLESEYRFADKRGTTAL